MTKEEWQEKLKKESIEQISGQGFGVNDWGSCQYSGALAFFEVYQSMRKDLDRKDLFELLGVEVTFNHYEQFQDAQLNLIKEMIENMSLNVDRREVKSIGYNSETIKLLTEALNAEDLFDVYRKSAWDLWSTAPHITNHLIKGLNVEGVKDAPGIGPELNQSFQSENYRTGLYCALLVDCGLITNNRCFEDFDT